MHKYPYAEQTKRKYLKSIGHFFVQKNYQHINPHGTIRKAELAPGVSTLAHGP